LADVFISYSRKDKGCHAASSSPGRSSQTRLSFTCSRRCAASLNDLICSPQHRWRDRQPEDFGRLDIDLNSNRVACSIGRSPGLAPFRILCANVGACRQRSGKLVSGGSSGGQAAIVRQARSRASHRPILGMMAGTSSQPPAAPRHHPRRPSYVSTRPITDLGWSDPRRRT
jgi:hypothetical protein